MTHRNPNPIPVCHLNELLLSLLLPVPPQHSLAHLFWLASRPSQLLAPRNRESGAPGFCASHSFYAQNAPHSHSRSTFPYLHPYCRRGHILIFYLLLRASPVLSAAILPSAVEEVDSNWLRGLLLLSPRSAVVVPPDTDEAFESCCCLRRLLY